MSRKERGAVLTLAHLNVMRAACQENGVADIPKIVKEMGLQHAQNMATQLLKLGYLERFGCGKYAWSKSAPQLNSESAGKVMEALREYANEARKRSVERYKMAAELKAQAERRKAAATFYPEVKSSKVMQERAIENLMFPGGELIRASLAMMHKKLDAIMRDLGLSPELANDHTHCSR